ncbi:MAG TPA: hypothetical protein VI756_02535, partial [Blastocatellia bacterium]
MNRDPRILLEPVRRMHREIMQAVVDECERATLEQTSEVDRDEEGDTIYKIDAAGEHKVLQCLEAEAAAAGGAVLIAEGIE